MRRLSGGQIKALPSGGAVGSASLTFEHSRALGAAAQQLTPGGVHSNARMTEQPFPLFFRSATDAHLQDVDGNILIDYVLGMGPMLLGHRPKPIIDAVVDQLGRGILYAGQHALEIAAAERLIQLVPCAERVRFNVTGTEAVQAAIRLARAATGRQAILKFQGHYHGWADSVLLNVSTRGQLVARGRLAAVTETLGMEEALLPDVLVSEWNDATALETIFQGGGLSIAAVLMEPVMANGVVIPPAEGFLELTRALCSRYGAILIFDEVITGFRVAPGGAQQRFGVVPDLAVFGKAIASGFPVAAVAGRRDLFDPIAEGRISHAGTFNGAPVGIAAAVATLDVLADPQARVYETLETRGGRLLEALRDVARAHSTAVLIQGLPMLFSVAFTSGDAIQNHAEAALADGRSLRRFIPHLLERGVRIAARGTWFLSTAHTDEDVERTVDAFDSALTAFEAV